MQQMKDTPPALEAGRGGIGDERVSVWPGLCMHEATWRAILPHTTLMAMWRSCRRVARCLAYVSLPSPVFMVVFSLLPTLASSLRPDCFKTANADVEPEAHEPHTCAPTDLLVDDGAAESLDTSVAGTGVGGSAGVATGSDMRPTGKCHLAFCTPAICGPCSSSARS